MSSKSFYDVAMLIHALINVVRNVEVCGAMVSSKSFYDVAMLIHALINVVCRGHGAMVSSKSFYDVAMLIHALINVYVMSRSVEHGVI